MIAFSEVIQKKQKKSHIFSHIFLYLFFHVLRTTSSPLLIFFSTFSHSHFLHRDAVVLFLSHLPSELEIFFIFVKK